MRDDRDAVIKADIALRQSLDEASSLAKRMSEGVDIFDDDEMLRYVFSTTRPEAPDRFGEPAVSVARIAISRRKFEGLFAEALKKFGTVR